MLLKAAIAAAFALALLVPAGAFAAILGESDAVAVSELVQERLHVDEIDTGMVAEPPYAIVYWKASKGLATGEALVKKADGTWTIVRMGDPPSLDDAQRLEKLGVPATQAKALVADLNVSGSSYPRP